MTILDPTRRALQDRIALNLSDARTIALKECACLVIHPNTVAVIFGDIRAASKWCYEHQLELLVTTWIDEGQTYFGNRETLAGGPEGIRHMREQIELSRAEQIARALPPGGNVS